MSEIKETVDWEEYVRSEVAAMLDLYLPETISGNVGIKYTRPVKEQYEGHVEYDNTKVSGVTIQLVFDFKEPLVIVKD